MDFQNLSSFPCPLLTSFASPPPPAHSCCFNARFSCNPANLESPPQFLFSPQAFPPCSAVGISGIQVNLFFFVNLSNCEDDCFLVPTRTVQVKPLFDSSNVPRSRFPSSRQLLFAYGIPEIVTFFLVGILHGVGSAFFQSFVPKVQTVIILFFCGDLPRLPFSSFLRPLQSDALLPTALPPASFPLDDALLFLTSPTLVHSPINDVGLIFIFLFFWTQSLFYKIL